jgi:hypothetical protein
MPALLSATALDPHDQGSFAWAGDNADVLSYSDGSRTVTWGPRRPEYTGHYPPAWVPVPTDARLHSGAFQWSFLVEEMMEAQIGVGFMLQWDEGLDWGFFGYLGAGHTAWAYDPSTGDIVNATKSICGGLPVFPDRRRGVVAVELDVPRQGAGRARFIVDGTPTPAIALPEAAVIVPAACLLHEGQRLTLSALERR